MLCLKETHSFTFSLEDFLEGLFWKLFLLQSVSDGQHYSSSKFCGCHKSIQLDLYANTGYLLVSDDD